MIGQLLLSIILKKARLFAGPSCKHIHLLMGILGILKSQSTFGSFFVVRICVLPQVAFWGKGRWSTESDNTSVSTIMIDVYKHFTGSVDKSGEGLL